MRAQSIAVATGITAALCAAVAVASCGWRSKSEVPSEGRAPIVVRGGGAAPPMDPFDDRYRVECPNIKASVLGDSAAATHEPTVTPSLAGPIAHIAEFHDCQRLRVNGGVSFGPLVGVWSRYLLASLESGDYANDFGVPVAELYNFTTTPYPDLGIAPGFNCLYMRGQGRSFEARMVSTASVNFCPPGNRTSWTSGKPLTVKRIARPEDAAYYPSAARWDWDESKNQHYIGLHCLKAWCEIGLGAFTSSNTYTGGPTERIKGWYDEQWLAVEYAPGHLVPAPRGRLIPVRNLDRLVKDDFYCADPCSYRSSWKHVADATISGNGAAVYRSKLNLVPGLMSEISIRFRVTVTGEYWQARIITGADTVFKRVLRVDHTGIEVPGTARWHWKEDDETAWVRCSAGCCEVGSDDIVVT